MNTILKDNGDTRGSSYWAAFTDRLTGKGVSGPVSRVTRQGFTPLSGGAAQIPLDGFAILPSATPTAEPNTGGGKSVLQTNDSLRLRHARGIVSKNRNSTEKKVDNPAETSTGGKP